MFTRISVQNFKCLGDFSRDLGALTLLTGLNAAGKSSTIQTLALVRQTTVDNEWSDGFYLNGTSVQLGTMFDVIDRNSGGLGFHIGLETSEWSVSWETLSRDRKTDLVARLSALSIGVGFRTFEWNEDQLRRYPLRRLLPRVREGRLFDVLENIGEKLSSISYVGAERIGPREVYAANSPMNSPDVGAQGEKTPWCLEQFGDSRVNPGLRLEGVPDIVRLTVQAWMNKLFPGFLLDLRRVDAANLITLAIRTSPRGEFFRPTNVGFGLTHVLPIITACVCARVDDTVIIENPEIHLHPAGQSMIGHFLALAASSGVQIILETHSDHVLNGVRRAVRDQQLQANSCKIYFFKAASGETPGLQAEVSEVTIDSRGRLEGWPDGFFDQMESDIDYIFRP